MTLFIACILLYTLGYSWPWYVVAFVIWGGHLAANTRGGCTARDHSHELDGISDDLEAIKSRLGMNKLHAEDDEI